MNKALALTTARQVAHIVYLRAVIKLHSLAIKLIQRYTGNAKSAH